MPDIPWILLLVFALLDFASSLDVQTSCQPWHPGSLPDLCGRPGLAYDWIYATFLSATLGVLEKAGLYGTLYVDVGSAGAPSLFSLHSELRLDVALSRPPQVTDCGNRT